MEVTRRNGSGRKGRGFRFFDAVNEVVLVINAATPPSLKRILQGFGLPEAIMAVAVNVLQQLVDALECFPILGLPVKVILKPFILEGKRLIHFQSPRVLPLSSQFLESSGHSIR